MKHSEELSELANAVSKMQGEIKDVVKDSQGYGYKYAKLDALLEAVRPLLAKHGLSIIQTCSNFTDGQLSGENTVSSVNVTTMLMHQSGQFISDTLNMPIVLIKGQTIAQSMGTSITYARRYAYAAMVCIAQTDNDAADEITNISGQKTNKSPYVCMTSNNKNVLELPKSHRLDADAFNKLIQDSDTDLSKILEYYDVEDISELSDVHYTSVVSKLRKKVESKSKLVGGNVNV